MKRVYIWTQFWNDEKIERCHWMDKFLMLHLLTREEMTTVGFIQIDPGQVAQKMNSTQHKPRYGLPALTGKHVSKSIDSLRRRKIIMVSTQSLTMVFFQNYLRHARWTPSVVQGWPRMIGQMAMPLTMEQAIRRACVNFCRRRNIGIPKGLRYSGHQKVLGPVRRVR